MSNLSKFVRSGLAQRQKPVDEHPDANLLVSFAEQELSARARAVLEEHLAGCPECREILSLSMPEFAAALPKARKRGIPWQRWQWSSLAPPAGVMAGAFVLAMLLAPRWRNPAPVHIQPPSTAPPSQADRLPLATPPLTSRVELLNLKLQHQASTAYRPGTRQASANSAMDPAAAKSAGNSLWRIEQNGTVSKSHDGKAWMPVRVDNQPRRLYALSADGTEVWAGGAGGGLFHSSDDGEHWRQVEVYDARRGRLADAITRIGSAPQHPLELTTDSGAVWFSFDGRLWRQQ